MGILEWIQEIISHYFIEETGYNPLNTLVYSLIGLGLIFAILRIIESLNALGRRKWPALHIEIFPDKPFWLALTPYILLGSVLRVLNDADVFSTRLLETPLIFFLIIIFALSALVVSYFIGVQAKIDWRWVFGGVGFVTLLYPIVQVGLRVQNLLAGAQVLAIWGLWLIGIFAARHFVGVQYFSDANVASLAAQMLDATATFVAVSFWNYTEKHVFPSFLFRQIGTWIFFPIKFGLVLGALITLDLWVDDPVFQRWLKVTIFLFGLATGMRDLFRLVMMT